MIKAVYRVSAVTEQALKITVLSSDLFRKEIKDPSSRFILTWWINRGPFPHECDTRTTKPVSTRLTHDQEQQKRDLWSTKFFVMCQRSCKKMWTILDERRR